MSYTQDGPIVCDYENSDWWSYSDDDPLFLKAALTGTATNTYPQGMRDAAAVPGSNINLGCYPNEAANPWLFGIGDPPADADDVRSYCLSADYWKYSWNWGMYPTWTYYDMDGPTPTPTHSDPVAGNVSADVKGDLKAYFHWEPYFFDFDDYNTYDPYMDPSYNGQDGDGNTIPDQPDPPKHLTVMVTTHLLAYADLGETISSFYTPPLSASASASIDAFKEDVSKSASPSDEQVDQGNSCWAYYADGYPYKQIGGSHLEQVDVSSGIATVSVSATTHAEASNSGDPDHPVSSDGLSKLEADSSGSVYARAIPYDTDLDLDIALTGTTKDTTDGSDNILVGQYCTASPVLTHCPSGYSVTGYQWSVSGTTFQGWSNTSPDDANASYYLDGPGALDQQAAGWYWNDDLATGAKTNETVSCMLTLHSSSGPDLTVTATKQVIVWRPKWTSSGSGGEMRIGVKSAEDGVSPSHYWLLAAPLPDSPLGNGMAWLATIASPDTSLFGDGTISLAQIVYPSATWIEDTGLGTTSTHTFPYVGENGLDTYFPYPWSPLTTPGHYLGGDSPYLDLTTYNALSATMNHQFEDYLMYMPPNSAQYVPLAHFVWSTDGTVTRPSPGGWAAFSGNAGTVSPSGTPVDFEQTNTFPEWTQIISVQNF